MSRYSPIAPITLLEQLYQRELLDNYLLLLAHDVLAEPVRYEQLALNIRMLDEDPFIIMDNSLIELGAAMDIDDVIEAASVVEADCILTPDALGGFEDTKRLVLAQKERLTTCQFPLMRVPQGTDVAELVQCVDWLRRELPTEDGTPEYWGIPRWIANALGSRIPIMQYAILTASYETSVQIHLLGMLQRYEDDMRCARFPDVMGIDSANPLVMGQKGLDIHQFPWEHMDRGDYWDHMELSPITNLNVEFIHNALNPPATDIV